MAFLRFVLPYGALHYAMTTPTQSAYWHAILPAITALAKLDNLTGDLLATLAASAPRATPSAPHFRPYLSRGATAFGVTQPLSEWAKDPRCKVCYQTLYNRLRKGTPLEQAMKPATRYNLG